jgi:hypothetical protein
MNGFSAIIPGSSASVPVLADILVAELPRTPLQEKFRECICYATPD